MKILRQVPYMLFSVTQHLRLDNLYIKVLFINIIFAVEV